MTRNLRDLQVVSTISGDNRRSGENRVGVLENVENLVVEGVRHNASTRSRGESGTELVTTHFTASNRTQKLVVILSLNSRNESLSCNRSLKLTLLSALSYRDTLVDATNVSLETVNFLKFLGGKATTLSFGKVNNFPNLHDQVGALLALAFNEIRHDFLPK